MRSYVLMEGLLPLVLRDCQSVPRGVALHEIREAAIIFCTKTRYWREDIVPVVTTADPEVTEYEIFCLAPGSRPVATLRLQVNGEPITAVSEYELDNRVPRWREETGIPRQFCPVSAAWIRLVPQPVENTYTLTGKIAVAPTKDGKYLLSDIVENHSETLAGLAKSRLMMIPNKPWSNPEQAVYHANLAESAMNTAGFDAVQNFGKRPNRRVTARFF